MTGSLPSGVIADIGGTNARFALIFEDCPGWHQEQRLKVTDYPDLAAAFAAYFALLPANLQDKLTHTALHAAVCVACPVLGDRIRLTNNHWDFSIAETQKAASLASLQVVNDFVGNALACPHLGTDDLHKVGGGEAKPGYPVAVIGPGTGLGVALMIPLPDGGWMPIATEGGHVTLSATSDEQGSLLRKARASHGHISAERLVSGPGLSLLYKLISNSDQRLPPPDIADRALDGSDPHARRALTVFCEFLGSTCGNLALTSGALGGVMLMGGILPSILDFFVSSPFRAAFEAKGRFNTYLQSIPTQVVIHPYPAFVGLEKLARAAIEREVSKIS